MTREEIRELIRLLFADDIGMFSKTKGDLQKKLKIMNDVFRKYGLEISAGKTKYQKIGRPENEPLINLKLPQGVIEQVKDFIYLGSVISEDGKSNSDIENRIKIANGNMRAFRRYFFSPRVNRQRKYRVLKTFFLGVVTYGCETWTLTVANKQKLDVWWMKQLRKCYGVTKKDKVRNEKILKHFKTEKLSNIIEKRRWDYYGHIYRFPEERWAKFLLTADLENPKRGLFANWRKQIDGNKRDAARIWEAGSQGRVFTDALASDKKTWAGLMKDIQVGRTAPLDIPEDLSISEGGETEDEV
jgi:hypothetical protein